MTPSEIISTSAFVISACSFCIAVISYRKQNMVKRFEIFQAFNKRFDDSFCELRILIENDDPKLETHDPNDKYNMIAFFEEIAIAVNSGIMSFDVAYYIFGYFPTAIMKSKHFRKAGPEFDLQSPFWTLFRDFANRVAETREKLGSRGIPPSKLRF